MPYWPTTTALALTNHPPKMAINTSGFAVQQMPQYTASNPNMVAFNPSVAIDGATKAMELTKLMEYIKAKREEAAENAATKASRVGSTISQNELLMAKNSKDIGLMPRLGQAEGLELNNRIDVAPIKGRNDVAAENQRGMSIPILAEAQRDNATTQIAQNAGIRTNLPVVTEADAASARGRIADGNRTVATAPSRTVAELGGYQADIAVKASQRATAIAGMPNIGVEAAARGAQAQQVINTAQDADATRPQRQMVTHQELADKIANGNADAAQLRDYKLAQTEKLRAEVEYFENGGRGKAERDPTTQLANVQRSMSGLGKEMFTLPDGNQGTLAVYKGETRDADGKIKQVGWFKNKVQVRLDPNAEAALELYDKYAELAKGLSNKATGALAPAAKAQAAATTPKVTNKAEYDKLPSKTEFVDANGKKWVKP